MVCSLPFSSYPMLMLAIVTGLIRNLNSCLPSMFRLYLILKGRHPEGHVTQEETDIVSSKRPLTAEASAEFIGVLEKQSENVMNAFAKQQEQAAVSLYSSTT